MDGVVRCGPAAVQLFMRCSYSGGVDQWLYRGKRFIEIMANPMTLIPVLHAKMPRADVCVFVLIWRLLFSLNPFVDVLGMQFQR